MPGQALISLIWLAVPIIAFGLVLNIGRFTAHSTTCTELLDAARAAKISAADLSAAGCKTEAHTFVVEKATR